MWRRDLCGCCRCCCVCIIGVLYVSALICVASVCVDTTSGPVTAIADVDIYVAVVVCIDECAAVFVGDDVGICVWLCWYWCCRCLCWCLLMLRSTVMLMPLHGFVLLDRMFGIGGVVVGVCCSCSHVRVFCRHCLLLRMVMVSVVCVRVLVVMIFLLMLIMMVLLLSLLLIFG